MRLDAPLPASPHDIAVEVYDGDLQPASCSSGHSATQCAVMNYWLMKSEPEEVSVDDAIAAPKSTVAWTGVRNYQARNYMRDQMREGDGVLFYHSSCPEPGIVGIGRVASTPYPDPTQFDKKSKYYDAKSKQEEPRWLLVDVQVTRKIPIISLAELRERPELAEMIVLKRGNRLSITPVEAKHWRAIVGKDKA